MESPFSLTHEEESDLVTLTQCRTLTELEQTFTGVVQAAVHEIRQRTAGADAFDVVELMRLRELQISMGTARESMSEGSAAAVELVALILNSRESGRHATCDAAMQPHEAIEELHRLTSRLLRLTTFRLMAQAKMRSHVPLSQLAAEYQASRVNIRSMQYASLSDHVNRTLFDNPSMDEVLVDILGFTYADYLKVRDAIRDRHADELTRLRDLVGEIALEEANGQGESPSARLDAFRQAILDMLFLPGARASFTAADLSSRTDLTTDQVTRILVLFSMTPEPVADPTNAVVHFLRGNNPVARTPLLTDREGNFLLAGMDIGMDSWRRLVEGRLRNHPRHLDRYRRIRQAASEGLTVDYLQSALETPPTATNLGYYSPSPGNAVDTLSFSCEQPSSVGFTTECDAMFVIDDVALCIEVKGRSIASAAQRGDVRRLERELSNTISSAAHQAGRLAELIKVNRGLWLIDKSWLDLSTVREVRSLAVTLDDVGPLAIAVDDLRRAGLLDEKEPPWITSLHDLAVICSVTDRPSEILLYVRRRTDEMVATRFRAVDELDLYMLFLKRGLFVEPDPDAVHALHPMSRPPTPEERERHREDDVPTRVGTFTDDLDAWIYWQDGLAPPSPKPSFNADPNILAFVDDITQRRAPGWFRFGADLLALSGEAQAGLVDGVNRLLEMTSVDRLPHSLVQSFASPLGYPSFFAVTVPDGHDHQPLADHLVNYMTAKKHQLRSDRALGVLVMESGRTLASVYMNDLPQSDDRVDEAGRAMRLRDPRAL